MARALDTVIMEIVTDAAGTPQSALVRYRIVDGNASKHAELTIDTPDFGKDFHDAGAVGEFWRDAVDEIKTAEGI